MPRRTHTTLLVLTTTTAAAAWSPVSSSTTPLSVSLVDWPQCGSSVTNTKLRRLSDHCSGYQGSSSTGSDETGGSGDSSSVSSSTGRDSTGSVVFDAGGSSSSSTTTKACGVTQNDDGATTAASTGALSSGRHDTRKNARSHHSTMVGARGGRYLERPRMGFHRRRSVMLQAAGSSLGDASPQTLKQLHVALLFALCTCFSYLTDTLTQRILRRHSVGGWDGLPAVVTFFHFAVSAIVGAVVLPAFASGGGPADRATAVATDICSPDDAPTLVAAVESGQCWVPPTSSCSTR